MSITFGDYLIDSGYYDPLDEETPCIECDGKGHIKSTNPERDKAWEVPCPICSQPESDLDALSNCCSRCSGDCSAQPGGPSYDCPIYFPKNVAWICEDERYPLVFGAVTTSSETVAAWVESGIKFTPLVRRLRSSSITLQKTQPAGNIEDGA